MIYKQIPFEVKDISEDNEFGYVRGKASYFGNVDSDGDIIDKGAYSKTLQENGYRVKYCWQHNLLEPIGKFDELYEGVESLDFLAAMPLKSSYCRDKFERIKGGVVDENSVGILPIRTQMQDGNRHLKEVKLFEISAVTLAANDLARISEAKGWSKEELAEKASKKYDDLIKFIRKGEITDETGYQIEGELHALKALFDMFTKPSIQDTLPNDKDVISGFLNMLKSKI